jgi:Zn finger protein HypA/HybF involved in hydrogenase expression
MPQGLKQEDIKELPLQCDKCGEEWTTIRHRMGLLHVNCPNCHKRHLIEWEIK